VNAPDFSVSPVDDPVETGQATIDFEAYRRGAADRAREHGLHAVRLADRDPFDRAVSAIRTFAELGWSFDVSDVRTRLVSPGSELGSAFSYLARASEIECCGYATAKHPAAHGRLVRVWRAAG
jgi:hypothetical protein